MTNPKDSEKALKKSDNKVAKKERYLLIDSPAAYVERTIGETYDL